nr:hypothetical protein [Nocardioides gansuensis]
MATQHGYRQQGERGLAAQGDCGPGNAGRVGGSGPHHEHAAGGHDDRGGDRPGMRDAALQQGSGQADQDRGASDRDRDHGGLGVLDAADDGDVEEHQSGRGEPAQPEPLHAARTGHPHAHHPGHGEQEHGRDSVPQRLRGEQWSADQCVGDADAAADEAHPDSAA